MSDVGAGALTSFLIRRNNATQNATDPNLGALDAAKAEPRDGLNNFVTIDLIAMIVSDAGLASGEPHWGNASPLGCALIGLQPRGGWQVIQRAVQWGNDGWANCFGVKCEMNILYQYFACTVRNRLEVWDSDKFLCPKEENAEVIAEAVEEVIEEKAWEEQAGDGDANAIRPAAQTVKPSLQESVATASKLRKASETPTVIAQAGNKWNKFKVDGRDFSLRRPTKLVDGSRGGQSYMCDLLRPDDGHEYGIDDQARMQFRSVMLVAASLIRNEHLQNWRQVFEEDFQLQGGLGVVFRRLLIGLAILNVGVILFVITVVYALFGRNIFKGAAAYVIQLCSFSSWGVGATALLMLGGNPRVKMVHKKIPDYVRSRLYDDSDPDAAPKYRDADANDNITLRFGSLHGALYEYGAGTCELPASIVEEICALDLRLVRTTAWYCGMVWFILFMGVSVVLQFAGSRVNTVGSQAMSVGIIILTSLARGAGVSGAEAWMIPKWKMRANASYGAQLLGQMSSRV